MIEKEHQEIFEKLSSHEKKLYSSIKHEHPDWCPSQIMTMLCVYLNSVDVMRGVGFDIANAIQLSTSEKNKLIKGCEDYYYKNIPLSEQDKNLLWRVRKKYHIELYGLSEFAIPKNIIDKIIY